MTTPCCVARRSVSTCAHHRWASTVRPVSPARLVTRQVLLTRGAFASAKRRHSQCSAKAEIGTLNYGMGEETLAKRLHCTIEEAVAKMERYLATYPGIKTHFNNSIEEVRRTGYGRTFLGRRRYLPDIAALGRSERNRAERQASNIGIQGFAADVAKAAMIRCHNAGLEKKYGCKMLLQVHDELMFQCPKETSKQAGEEIKECMEHPFETDFSVKLEISMGIAGNWSAAK